TGAIGLSFVLSLIGFVDYFAFTAPWVAAESHAEASTEGHIAPDEPAVMRVRTPPSYWSGEFDWVSLGGMAAGTQERRGVVTARPALKIPLGVFIDNLGVIMFLMVSFIATLIHIYSIGYMHGDPRYPRFFAYLSLFCFSMLGLVASSNVFMIFMFWELVG